MTIRCLTPLCKKVLLKNVKAYIGYLYCRHCKETRYYEVITKEGLQTIRKI